MNGVLQKQIASRPFSLKSSALPVGRRGRVESRRLMATHVTQLLKLHGGAVAPPWRKTRSMHNRAAVSLSFRMFLGGNPVAFG